ncbi:ferrochelatase [Neisseria sp. HSC-16F19]|nr:ferrochelatase [Neisseria sp. HSC-16F19]MCP2041268.1 ferrochelatase [Neisseria sp. HSC-16F19]
MTRHFLPEPPAQAPRIGVLLINLGTPAAPTRAAVKPFLRRFLSDPRVVELPRLPWQILLHGLILPFRSGQSAHGYEKIWQAEGSPLAVYGERMAQALAARLPDCCVAHATSYGEPTVAATLADFKRQGVDRLLVLPLYPQYAASASAAALDQVWRVLLQQRHMMAVRSITRYGDDAGYLDAVAGSIRRHWQQHGRGEHLLFSFHGIPAAQHQAGDPYVAECERTAAALAQRLALTPEQYTLAFQSRFGRAEWVGPSTQDLLQTLPQNGVKKLDIVCPGFAVDCLETLEEIALQGREDFHASGGTQYHYIPCLNDHADWLDALYALVQRHLQGWTE